MVDVRETLAQKQRREMVFIKMNDKRIERKEDQKTAKAEAEYEQIQREKEERQAKGLGAVIKAAPNKTEEEANRKKKAQGLGSAISGGGSTLG